METRQGEASPLDPAPVGVADNISNLLATPAHTRGAHRNFSFRRVFVLAVVAVTGVTGLVILLYAAGIHSATPISDGASVVLQGQAIANGHVLLHGWTLSYDSFWTVDAPIYGLAYLIVGIRPSLLFAVPAAIAAVVIVVGMIMAHEGRRRAAAVAGAVTVAALLAFPTHAFAQFFVRGPFHVVTALYALFAFAGLRRRRFGWGWALAVLFLTLAMLGDLQIVFYGIVPVFLSGIVAMMRERTWRGGIVTSSSAVVAVVLTVVLRKIFEYLGAFTIGPANPIASLHQMLTNTTHVVSYGLELIGARSVHYGTGGVPGDLQAVRVLAAVLMTVCFVACTCNSRAAAP